MVKKSANAAAPLSSNRKLRIVEVKVRQFAGYSIRD